MRDILRRIGYLTSVTGVTGGNAGIPRITQRTANKLPAALRRYRDGPYRAGAAVTK